MYNYQNKIKIFLILFIWIFLWCSGELFGYDLSDKIYTSFSKIYDKGLSDKYLDAAYSSKYPKDPFWDALENADNMKMQLKIAWAQYIEDELAANNCSLSKKKIWWILYYYVPEFRAEVARNLKVEIWDFNVKKFIFDKSTIDKYCKEYVDCRKSKESKDKSVVTASTSSDPATNCKEYFQSAYAKWSADEQRMQDVKKSQAWNDKFRNASIDDSPYDIMSDLKNIGILLYEQVTEPLTPVLYNLPVFSNSTQSLLDSQNDNYAVWDKSWWSDKKSGWWNKSLVWWSVKNSVWWNGVTAGNLIVNKDTAEVSWQGFVSLWNKNDGGESVEDKSVDVSKTEKTWLAIGLNKSWLSSWFISDVYDDLVEWLWAISLADKWTLFYGSLCNDDEVEVEPEWPIEQVGTTVVVNDEWYQETILSAEEYEEIVDYMLSAVDQYNTLPEWVQTEIFGDSEDGPWPWIPSTPGQDDEEISEIKGCIQSCEWLRWDQYLSCVEMCACWERNTSEIGLFDPDDGLWLWPIAGVKLCSVPGKDMSFSEGGRKIMSIEEWGNEILWVVDKLSREWKLWTRTQQSNFLDSSTKNMKLVDTVAFSISVENVDIFKNFDKISEQSKKKALRRDNQVWQATYNISSSLNNPSRKNQYRIVWYTWEVINDYRWTIDVESLRQSQEIIGTAVDYYVNKLEDSNADRYVSISENVDTFIEQQADLWKEIKRYMEYMTQYAEALYAKKK